MDSEGGSLFRKRVVETIYLSAKIEEDEKVKRLKEELKIAKEEIEEFKETVAYLDGLLRNREPGYDLIICDTCKHDITTDPKYRNHICLSCYCIDQSICTKWCIEKLGLEPIPTKKECKNCLGKIISRDNLRD